MSVYQYARVLPSPVTYPNFHLLIAKMEIRDLQERIDLMTEENQELFAKYKEIAVI